MSSFNFLLKNKRIFMIEDSPNNFAIAKMLLEQQGATVWFDRYGDSTFSRLQEFAPVDLILLDLMFPNNVTGYDLFDQIRLLPTHLHTPIVAVSASDPSVAIPKTRSYGFQGFIPKPLNFEFFARQIAQVVNDQQEIWITSS